MLPLRAYVLTNMNYPLRKLEQQMAIVTGSVIYYLCQEQDPHIFLLQAGMSTYLPVRHSTRCHVEKAKEFVQRVTTRALATLLGQS